MNTDRPQILNTTATPPPIPDSRWWRCPKRGWFGLSLLLVLSSVVSLANADDNEPLNPSVEVAPRLFLVGDSTMANKPVAPPNPERGWGQLLPLYVRYPERIHNHARNGKSTRSFREQGLWNKVLGQLRPQDWVLIQFGHNDAAKNRPQKSTTPEQFAEFLRAYVAEVRAVGAHPMLATPIAQRRFNAAGEVVDSLTVYCERVRAVAAEVNVPLLDVHTGALAMLETYGQERSKQLFLWNEPGDYDSRPEGVSDDTHLSAIGASRIAELVTAEWLRLDLPLAAWLK